MQKVAQSWLVLQLTGSTLYLGLDDFLGQLPILLFTLVGGVIADRHDRRRLLLGSQYVQMATAFTLAALVFVPMGFDAAQLLAIRPDGQGDVTASHVAWRFGKGAPSKPSVLLVGDLIFMVNDAGIVATVDARRGEMVWRGRIDGTYSASPIAAGGRIYAFNEDGKTTVLEAGREFKVLAENVLDDGFMASPAVDGRALYLRTRTHVYRIEESPSRSAGQK